MGPPFSPRRDSVRPKFSARFPCKSVRSGPQPGGNMRFKLFVLCVGGWPFFAGAEEVQTSDGTNQISVPRAERVMPETTNSVTDVKLKAESGSRSKYSMKLSLSYYGPPVGDLGNDKQPNPDGSIGNYSTSLGGSISARYRFDSERALSLGSGVSALTPFHGIKRFDLRTPYISYDHTAREGGWQFRRSVGASITTLPEYREVGQYSTLSGDLAVVRDLGSSWSASLEGSLSYFLYNRSYERTDGRAGRYNLGFYPGLKYSMSDRLRFSTSVALSFWNPRRLENEWALWNKTVTQRLGLEYALRRDIFFAPYLSFYPEDANLKSTTFNMSTIFSIL